MVLVYKLQIYNTIFSEILILVDNNIPLTAQPQRITTCTHGKRTQVVPSRSDHYRSLFYLFVFIKTYKIMLFNYFDVYTAQ